MVKDGAPGTRHLVHMKTHNKLVASVWLQIWHRHRLFGTVDEEKSHVIDIKLYSHYN